MGKKIHKLKVEPEHDFLLVGISSHDNDYRLSWAINTELETNFLRVNDIVLFNDKLGEEQEFSRYAYMNEDEDSEIWMLSNTGLNGFLFPELKTIDYILLFRNLETAEVENFLTRLKSVSLISTAFIIATDQLKPNSKKLLMHLNE